MLVARLILKIFYLQVPALVFLLASANISASANTFKCPFARDAGLDAAPAVLADAAAMSHKSNLDSFNSSSKNAKRAIGHNPMMTHTSIFPEQFSPGFTPFECATWPLDCRDNLANSFYRSLDGTCNNLDSPNFGMARTRYARMLPTDYQLKRATSGAPLPNARELSLRLFGDATLPENNLSMMLMQFGQFVAHDLSKFEPHITPDSCCSTSAIERSGNAPCLPIYLNPLDPIFIDNGSPCLDLTRAIADLETHCILGNESNSGEKLSVVTGYLDLSSLYGNSAEECHTLRTHIDGQLIASHINGQHFLPVSENDTEECAGSAQCFVTSDRRNRFTPIITVIQTLFLREHNRIAAEIAQSQPGYNDEIIFQEARKMNIAQYQKIVYYEYLPFVLGREHMLASGLIYNTTRPHKYINDYDPKINAAPLAESAAAAFRYSHSQIPGWFLLIQSPDARENYSLRLGNYFNQLGDTCNLLTYDNFFVGLLRGLLYERQKRSDRQISPELKYYFNRFDPMRMGSDLKAIDIQRARDFSLPTYNQMREFCKLKRANDWSELRNELPNEIIELLKHIYETPDDVDLAIGAALESHLKDSLFGPTFHCILVEQFLRARRGDRFFFENDGIFSKLKESQLAEVRKTSLASILCNTEPNLEAVQLNAFMIPSQRNPLFSCNQIYKMDLSKLASNF